MYETHENPDVLQREWVEATSAVTAAHSDLVRRDVEARNAQAQYDAAKQHADDLEVRYLQAREDARPTSPTPAEPAAKTPKADLAPANAKADEAPSL